MANREHRAVDPRPMTGTLVPLLKREPPVTQGTGMGPTHGGSVWVQLRKYVPRNRW
jgi:hypothetical protein